MQAPAKLPSGVVTFVLTDIEGSTRLLRRLEERYDEVLDRQVALLRRTWEDHGGAHVSATGDSCLGAFDDPTAAVRACAEAQRRLAAEPWPVDGRPRVRMGVHSGLASPRAGDYVALAVHQAARVMAAAHGGQVLVSEATAERCEALDDLELRPVGRYRLRDFDDAVALYSVSGPGLDDDFPWVRATPVDGHNLTAPPTSFLGRADDVGKVRELLAPGRLLTLTGPGGVGKSRLGVSVGMEATSSWDDGVWLVDLAPVHDARLVGTAVAHGIGVTAGKGSDRWEDVLEHLRDRRALLVLDNCEHLAAELAAMVGELLVRCPQIGVLATSREPLGTAGERVWRVDVLGVPRPGADVGEALVAPAVQLFVDRAGGARPGFALDDTNVETVVQLCRRLDGLPLALELAAAQTAVMNVAELLERLDDRFRVLRSRGRDVPDRQRTMDAVMAWSFRLLGPDEQRVLRRLGVFRTGFSLDAAEVAGGDVEGGDVAESLWALVDKSLVVVDLGANETRYTLLETVRAYARRLLDEEGEAVVTARRLTAWWLERLGPWHPMDRARSGEIEVELDNLRALVLLIAGEAEEQAQQLACSIGRYYYAVHVPRDGAGELSRYAEQLTTPSPARVSLLATLALLHVQDGDIEGARRVVAEGEEVRRHVGRAPDWDEVGLERASGEVAIRSGDHAMALELGQEALERALGEQARARMLNLVAIASYFMGDVDRAEAAFLEELDMARRRGDEHLLAIAEGNVAELAMRRGDVGAAARHQSASLDLALALGRPVSVAHSLIVAARLTAASDPVRAATLHAKAETVLAECGHRLYEDDARASAEMLDQVALVLGDVDFERAAQAGRALSLLDAASLAQHALALVSA